MGRSFTRRQRISLLLKQRGKCWWCGDHMGFDTHAHHIVRWSDGGKTTLDNGALVHHECHKKIHANDGTNRKRQTDIMNRKADVNYLKELKYSSLREPQAEALEAFKGKFDPASDAGNKHAFILPPRTGKSDLIRAISYESQRMSGGNSWVLVLVPNEFLREQGKCKEDRDAFKKRYGVPIPSPDECTNLLKQIDIDHGVMTGGNRTLYACAQMAVVHSESLIKAVLAATSRGIKPVIVVDESQLLEQHDQCQLVLQCEG